VGGPRDVFGVEQVRPNWPLARVAFAAVYLALQAILVVTAPRRADHAFGFQMFSESCTIRFNLSREVAAPSGHGAILVPAWRGEWAATDEAGEKHHFDWRDRVKSPLLATFDTPFEASYGQAAALSRMQAALDDVAEHIEADAETRRLIVDATVKRNGREPVVVRLQSPNRPLAR
jgi:hypothetical protein